MERERDVLGACPACDAAVAAGDVLIEYRTADGQAQSYAECPDCRRVVHPR